jgi:hypothetical protein
VSKIAFTGSSAQLVYQQGVPNVSLINTLFSNIPLCLYFQSVIFHQFQFIADNCFEPCHFQKTKHITFQMFPYILMGVTESLKLIYLIYLRYSETHTKNLWSRR